MLLTAILKPTDVDYDQTLNLLVHVLLLLSTQFIALFLKTAQLLP